MKNMKLDEERKFLSALLLSGKMYKFRDNDEMKISKAVNCGQENVYLFSCRRTNDKIYQSIIKELWEGFMFRLKLRQMKVGICSIFGNSIPFTHPLDLGIFDTRLYDDFD